ncbi:MAG: zinc-finger-containing protein [bacterium]|nr:zinc-finger-containing protein [bacterium]
MEIDQKRLEELCDERGIDVDFLRGKKCPYCKGETEYKDSSYIYGKSYGMVYLCEPCDAYVGVHHKTSKESLGSVANGQLRYWRKQAHAAFDPIAFADRENPFSKKKWNRHAAYGWLRRKLDLPRELCHIGMFSINKCKQVVEICKTTPWNEQNS